MFFLQINYRLLKGLIKTKRLLPAWLLCPSLMSLIFCISRVFVPKGIILKESLYCNQMVHL